MKQGDKVVWKINRPIGLYGAEAKLKFPGTITKVGKKKSYVLWDDRGGGTWFANEELEAMLVAS